MTPQISPTNQLLEELLRQMRGMHLTVEELQALTVKYAKPQTITHSLIAAAAQMLLLETEFAK